MSNEATEATSTTPVTATGYKATDKDIKCLNYQFIPGQWHEYDGEIKLCESGFHFCEQPSGPWCYYTDPTTRIWKVEAQGVLDTPREPGADFKLVCKRIRLVEEVLIGGDRNTGDRNTGYMNTGYRNTGYRNTGNMNTGDRNTGDMNTGYRNTGNMNTGDRNTGDRNTGYMNTGYRNTGNMNTGDMNTGDMNTGYRNTGYRNTGDRNTGDRNTGYRNTVYRNPGDRNTGDRNTGDWNATNHSAGFFCQQEPSVICFDVDTGLSRGEFLDKHGRIAADLGRLLLEDSTIDFDRFSSIPGITIEKLTSLHKKLIDAKSLGKLNES